MTAAGWHLQGVCCAAQSALQAQGAGEEQALDDEIAQLVAKVETHKMRRDFMRSLAERPLPFVHDVVCRLALDLATIRSEGSSSRLFAPTNARTHAHTRTRAHALAPVCTHAGGHVGECAYRRRASAWAVSVLGAAVYVLGAAVSVLGAAVWGAAVSVLGAACCTHCAWLALCIWCAWCGASCVSVLLAPVFAPLSPAAKIVTAR